MKKRVSIIVSLYNEALAIPDFWNSLNNAILQLEEVDAIEILWVNDGSNDDTSKKINEIITVKDDKIEHVLIEFSRNYGHEAAMIAGIDYATGDALICMDADLQHPPEKISTMLSVYSSGFDVVLAHRKEREDSSLFKKALSTFFYTFLNAISTFKFNKNASDFFLISKRVQQILKDNYRERNRFLRGYAQIVGFNATHIEYNAPKRIAGKSNYSYKKLVKLSFDAVFSFSNKPLQVASYISILFVFFTVSIGVYSFVTYFIGDKPPSGYTTLIIFTSICFSFLFIILAILSIYFSKALDEIRERPIYIIKKLVKG